MKFKIRQAVFTASGDPDFCVAVNQIQMVQAKLTQDTNAFDGNLGQPINK